MGLNSGPTGLLAGIFGSLDRTDLLVGAPDGDSIYPGQPSAADLTLFKSHTGNCGRGSTGTYRLTVNNVGPVATIGVVTVTDTLPASSAILATSASATQVARI
jgi:uncharacterized repeat protein (TIGR01451 family)